MSYLNFDIKGRPVPWKRLRTSGKRRFPAEGQVEAKNAVIAAFNAERLSEGLKSIPMDSAVSLSILAVYKLPEIRKRGDERKMGSHHVFKPDADNIAKLVKDALSGHAYKDDAQVFSLSVRKVWSDHFRTSITLEYIGDR